MGLLDLFRKGRSRMDIEISAWMMRKTKSLWQFFAQVFNLQNQWHLRIMSTLAAVQCPDWWTTDRNLDSDKTAKWTDGGFGRGGSWGSKCHSTKFLFPCYPIFFHTKLWNGSKGFRLYGKKTGGPLKSLGLKVHCIKKSWRFKWLRGGWEGVI